MSESQKQNITNHTPKWYRKMAVWKVVLAILTPLGGGELVLLFANVQLPAWVHVLAGTCAVFLLILKGIVKDVDGDGYVD